MKAVMMLGTLFAATAAIAASPQAGPRIDALTKADIDLAGTGAACWAVDAQKRDVAISVDIALVRIDGKLVRVMEKNGEIGGDVLRSADDRVVVIFQKRPGREVHGEESTGRPATMTVSAGGRSSSLTVTRWCGA